MYFVFILFMIILLTLISGWGDAQGFIHAARIWKTNHIVWDELFKSALYFFGGITSYWFSIKYLQEVGIITPEIQTIGWLIVTTISVSIISGKSLKWQATDQVLAITLIIGLCLLIYRTSR